MTHGAPIYPGTGSSGSRTDRPHSSHVGRSSAHPPRVALLEAREAAEAPDAAEKSHPQLQCLTRSVGLAYLPAPRSFTLFCRCESRENGIGSAPVRPCHLICAIKRSKRSCSVYRMSRLFVPWFRGRERGDRILKSVAAPAFSCYAENALCVWRGSPATRGRETRKVRCTISIRRGRRFVCNAAASILTGSSIRFTCTPAGLPSLSCCSPGCSTR